MKFRIYFKDQNSAEYNLEYELLDSPIAKKWGACLQEQCSVNNSIRERDRLYGFPDNSWSKEIIVNEINKCIDSLNQNNAKIKHKANVTMMQNDFNTLHYYFETLRGGVLTPAKFWEQCSCDTKSDLERFNILIHRGENFWRGNTGICPRIVCCFEDRIERVELDESDYQHFTLEITYGNAYINYCEVGKPLCDVFRDNDDIISDSNIRPLRYYSPDMSLYFFNFPLTSPKLQKFISDMDTWWDQNNEYLSNLGLTKDDPKNAIGHIPVAKLIKNENKNEIIDNLASHNEIDRVDFFE